MANIVLGITGGIAAYKATGLIRGFTELGHDVKVIPTANALRFIGATTLEALSHNAVDPDLYSDVDSVKHVALGQSADLILVAPTTATTIARLASGFADDLLASTVLASTAPVLLVPAMHTEMWLNQATQTNVETLRSRNINVMEPASGRLTGDDSGIGRLPEIEDILEVSLSFLRTMDLVGKRILVTAGGTQEAIDPVRFIGNRSSGKQGLAIAKAALARGADVIVIGANLEAVTAPNLRFVSVRTASEMESALNSHLATIDFLIMCAAVSDYRVAKVSSSKLKKSVLGDNFTLDLVANPDILATSVSRINSEALACKVVGFAAETTSSEEELIQLAKHKLSAKGCDAIVANNVAGGGVFGEDSTKVAIIGKKIPASSHSGTKTAVANAVIDILGQL